MIRIVGNKWAPQEAVRHYRGGMHLRVATLCDFAQVRGGLLTVVSAGITRAWRRKFPAACGLMVALAFELTPLEALNETNLRLRLENADGQKLAEVGGTFRATPGMSHDPGEMIVIPFVADFRNLQLPAEGRYQVLISVPDTDVDHVALSFRAALRPSKQNPDDS